MPAVINGFTGDYAWLDNNWPCVVSYLGIEYKSVDHGYYSLRCADPVQAEVICLATNPYHASSRTKEVVNWNIKGDLTLFRLLEAKFAHPELMEQLQATGDAELIPTNTVHDNRMGHCICPRCEAVEPRNLIGEMLTILRASHRLNIERKLANPFC